MATSTRTEPRLHQSRKINHPPGRLLAAIKWVIDLFLEALPFNLGATVVVIVLRVWFDGQFTASFITQVTVPG